MPKAHREWFSIKKNLLLVTLFLFLCLVVFLYMWRVGTLTAGVSSSEAAAFESSSALETIVKDPVYGMHKLGQLGVKSIGQSGAFWIRLVSVFFGLVFILTFYKLAKFWFGKTIGFLGTLLFATTPWVILSSRNGAPEIMLLAPVVLLAAYAWLVSNDSRKTAAWFMFVSSVSVLAFIPGVLWFLAAIVAIDFKRIKAGCSQVNMYLLVAGLVIFFVVISPLILASVAQPDVAKSIAFVPIYWQGIGAHLISLGWAIPSIIWRTEQAHELVIDRLPFLNIMQLALVVFGIFAMWAKARREFLVLLSAIVIGALAYSTSQDLAFLAIALPSLALLATAGLRYLYMEWKSVFPHNPLAKFLAIGIIAAVVSLHILIGVRYTLAAWPNTQATKNIYVIK